MKRVLAAMEKHWGYSSFLPLQREAIEAVLAERDSVVVLPTGGGKSLCYQAPALAMPGMAVVVSPLISLMKDQVDAMRLAGAPAACLNSGQSAAERDEAHAMIRSGDAKVLYVSPERLLMDGFIDYIKRQALSFIAIDEAHCISSWGHDFRPIYRQLCSVKEAFAGLPVHAYTATATPQVREDIARQLNIEEADMLVGSFDRPNLFYRVEARQKDGLEQTRRVLNRHFGESAIIYCISRKNVEQTAARLCRAGYRALPYHAGLDADTRRRNQEAFIQDEAEIVVATVAFGMGIDKSNVRAVIHLGMPKSIEHYQQESGRAGRDGLESECCLFYAKRDYGMWRRMFDEFDAAYHKTSMRKLSDMYRYCIEPQCRHRALVGYFGEWLEGDCGACDFCRGEAEEPGTTYEAPSRPTPPRRSITPAESEPVDDPHSDSLVIAQKILSCVVRLKERETEYHTARVLLGSTVGRIEDNGHNQLSTHGLLSEYPLKVIREWIAQLVGQGFLDMRDRRSGLGVTEKGWQAIRGEATPLLSGQKPKRQSRERPPELTGDDDDLFQELRQLRMTIARGKHVPPYVVFSDATLRDMVKRRPTTLNEMLEVKGIGSVKLSKYGEKFTEVIRDHVEA